MKSTTYLVRVSPGRRDADAEAAAAAINKKLGDAGVSSFISSDTMAEATADREIDREIEACWPSIRSMLYVERIEIELPE